MDTVGRRDKLFNHVNARHDDPDDDKPRHVHIHGTFGWNKLHIHSDVSQCVWERRFGDVGIDPDSAGRTDKPDPGQHRTEHDGRFVDRLDRCVPVHDHDRPGDDHSDDDEHVNHKDRAHERNVVRGQRSGVECQWIRWHRIFAVDIHALPGRDQPRGEQSTSDDRRPRMDSRHRSFVLFNHNDATHDDPDNSKFAVHLHGPDWRNKLYIHRDVSQFERTRRCRHFVPGDAHAPGRRHKLGSRYSDSREHAAHMDRVAERHALHTHDIPCDDDRDNHGDVIHKDGTQCRNPVHVLRDTCKRVR